jgi:glutathione S-transferase
VAVEQIERAGSNRPRDGAAGPATVPVLWHLKPSHYNEKVRWALDYKGISHRRRAAVPGRHQAIAKRLTGGTTLPVLVLDGRAIGDSTRIIEALERRYPESPLYPADPEARRRALELEDFFDEELGPYSRRLVMKSALPSPRLFLGIFAPDLSGRRRAMARAMFPLIRRRVIKQFAISGDSIEEAFAKIAAAGERFRAELQPSGYLVGDGFTVADLTAAALVAPAVAPEQFPYPQPQRGHPLFAELREALATSGMLDWAKAIYLRHRGRSAEVKT